MKRLLALFLCALLFLGCELTSGDDTTPLSQRFLFEVEHINFAWGTYRVGFYVDNQGHVYSYDFSEEGWTPRSPERFTEAELQEKYSHNQEQIGTVDRAVLQDMFALIRPAGNGALSEPVQRCADAGVTSFRAYLYDAGGYTPVLLRAEGDVAQKNASDSAEALLAWLRTLDERFSHPFCEP